MTKNSYKIGENTITVTKGFWNKAANPLTLEAQTMLYWKQVFPHHEVVVRASNANKQTHKRLTEAFMLRYIATRVEAKNIMLELETLRNVFLEEHEITADMTESEIKEINKKKRTENLAWHTRMKSWFIDKYPDYSNTVAFAKYIKETVIDKSEEEALSKDTESTQYIAEPAD